MCNMFVTIRLFVHLHLPHYSFDPVGNSDHKNLFGESNSVIYFLQIIHQSDKFYKNLEI
jgi:hypothetical protein